MTDARAATPWGAMLRTGCGLGIGPDAFWRMSLKEWRMLTDAPGRIPGMAREDLERLIAAWPDEGSNPDD